MCAELNFVPTLSFTLLLNLDLKNKWFNSMRISASMIVRSTPPHWHFCKQNRSIETKMFFKKKTFFILCFQLYLNSIKSYYYNDDTFNFNYGQAKAAVGKCRLYSCIDSQIKLKLNISWTNYGQRGVLTLQLFQTFWYLSTSPSFPSPVCSIFLNIIQILRHLKETLAKNVDDKWFDHLLPKCWQ